MNSQVKIEEMHRPPTHPGLMLLEEFIKPLNMTQVELAEAINVPIQRVNEIINQKRGVSPETAWRLSKYFGVSASFWLGLQKKHDLWNAYQKEKVHLSKISPRNAVKSGMNKVSSWLEGLVEGEWNLPGTYSKGRVVFAGPHEKATQLYLSQSKVSASQEAIPTSMEDSDALAYLIQSTDDEGVRRQAIDLLSQIAPDHALFEAVREKDLSVYIEQQSVALRVMFIPRIDKRYSVLVRVYATRTQRFLPEGLKLIVLDENGNEVAIHEAREHDDWLDRPLVVDAGDQFGIRISLNDSAITETFTV